MDHTINSIYLLTVAACISQEHSLPLKVPAFVTEGSNGYCPSTEMRSATRDALQEEILSLLNSEVIPVSCACAAGLWTRVVHLDLSDPSHQCPDNWTLTSGPVRGCGRSSAAAEMCDSAFFSSGGQSYSRVCGRLNAYQRGSPDAFDPSNLGFGANPNPGVEGVYIDGVSLTHGAAGSRQHIWTFAAAAFQTPPNTAHVRFTCPCTVDDWPNEIPSFIGNNYFCATGNVGPSYEADRVYSEDPLWDGEGCGPGNTCCVLNNPPWFCTTLPQATTDAFEVRICLDQDAADEDVVVSLIDIYII